MWYSMWFLFLDMEGLLPIVALVYLLCGRIFTSGDSTLVYKCPLENNNKNDKKSVNELIEHGSIETNELNMTLMSHMTHHDSV